MIVICDIPIAVITPKGDGYLLYVESGGMHSNDIWTCCLQDGGEVYHFQSTRCKIFKNSTFEINERKTDQENTQNG